MLFLNLVSADAEVCKESNTCSVDTGAISLMWDCTVKWYWCRLLTPKTVPHRPGYKSFTTQEHLPSVLQSQTLSLLKWAIIYIEVWFKPSQCRCRLQFVAPKLFHVLSCNNQKLWSVLIGYYLINQHKVVHSCEVEGKWYVYI